MLSDPNLSALLDEGLGFIVPRPLSRNAYETEVIGSVGKKFDRKSDTEQFQEELREQIWFVDGLLAQDSP